MLILLISYILITCACLRITYYVFSQCAMEGEGKKILLMILISFIPVMNFIALLVAMLSIIGDILIEQLNEQLKRRKP